MPTQTITLEHLAQTGIDIDETEALALVEQLNATLEERVGEEITNALDDTKLGELMELRQTASETEMSQWIETNVPDLDAIIDDEIDILLGELSENTERLSK